MADLDKIVEELSSLTVIEAADLRNNSRKNGTGAQQRRPRPWPWQLLLAATLVRRKVPSTLFSSRWWQ